MSRTFVIGDIHGAKRALIQCLQKAEFDYENDTLICLGDVADGWPETREAVEELMKIKNLVYMLGNHDFWTLEWLQSGYAEDLWMMQGGEATIKSYKDADAQSHIEFFRNAKLYHTINNSLFVHAGIQPGRPLEQQSIQTFLWDRDMVRLAQDFHQKGLAGRITDFDNVFVGHTPIPSPHPVQYCEVWMMDTGAGWSGVLSMMDIATQEFFTSDSVPLLYPGVEGRRKK